MLGLADVLKSTLDGFEQKTITEQEAREQLAALDFNRPQIDILLACRLLKAERVILKCR